MAISQHHAHEEMTPFNLDYGWVGNYTATVLCTITVFHTVHTVCIYAYGITVHVWYGYLYHMCIATILLLSTNNIIIATTSTVLLFILDNLLYPWRSFL